MKYTTQEKMKRNQNLYPYFSNAVGDAPSKIVEANHWPEMDHEIPKDRMIIGKISDGYCQMSV